MNEHPLAEAGQDVGSTAALLLAADLENAQLRTALDNRDVIGQAKGMIRLLTGCDAPSAFDILSRISQDTNRKVRDLAELITESAPSGGTLPADVHASWRRHIAAVKRAASTTALPRTTLS